MLERTKLEKEVTEVTARNLKLDDKIKELERKCQDLTANMYEAREKVNFKFGKVQIKLINCQLIDYLISWHKDKLNIK